MTLAVQALAAQHDDLSDARRAMIDSQLRVSGINQDWVLAAVARAPREDFVPVEARASAYIDRSIPLGKGRAMPAPLVQAMLLAEAAPQADDTVLVIAETGYLAALVEGRAQSVETVDAAGALSLQAKSAYSLVLIDGAVEVLPQSVIDAVDENGRVVCGLAERGVTRLAVARKSGGAAALVARADVGMPVLAEFAAPKTWSF